MFNTNEENLKAIQNELEKYIVHYVQYNCNCWAGHLENTNIESGYVDLQVLLMDSKRQSQCTPIITYQDLFQDDLKQVPRQTIIVTGEPGCGKSMYVRKLAYDWANGDSYLKNKFDLVLLFDKYLLTTSVKDGLKQFVSPEFQNFFATQLENSAKVLFIFDGLNELNESDEIHEEIKSIIKHEIFPMATVITTTRCTVWDEVPYNDGDYLLVDGFNDVGVEKFMTIQKCNRSSNEAISDLLHLPFFCALYCSLERIGCLTTNVSDLFDLIKIFVDNAIKSYFQKSEKIVLKDTIHDNMMVIGKYSLIHLVNPEVEELCDLKFALTQNSFDYVNECEVQLGLLIKKQVPAGVHSKFKEEWNVLHYLIAEYLASYYIANILNLELHLRVRQSVLFERPLTEYVLYNILLLWEDGKFSNTNVKIYLENSETCFLWYCKKQHMFENLQDKLQSLKSLVLKGLNMGRNVTCFANVIKCENLRTLGMSHCNVNSHSAYVLANVFSQKGLPELEMLCIGDDIKIGKETNIFEALGNCESLRNLQIWNCNTTLASLAALERGMNADMFLNLASVTISSNADIGKNATFFIALRKCPKLKHLLLKKCNVMPESLRAFTDGINSNAFPNLEFLEFSNSKEIGSEFEFFSSLGKLDNLSILDVCECNVTQKSLQALVTQINLNKLTNLRMLIVSKNESVGHELSFLNALARLQELKYLDIHGCGLSTAAEMALDVLRSNGCEVNDTDDTDG